MLPKPKTIKDLVDYSPDYLDKYTVVDKEGRRIFSVISRRYGRQTFLLKEIDNGLGGRMFRGCHLTDEVFVYDS